MSKKEESQAKAIAEMQAALAKANASLKEFGGNEIATGFQSVKEANLYSAIEDFDALKEDMKQHIKVTIAEETANAFSIDPLAFTPESLKPIADKVRDAKKAEQEKASVKTPTKDVSNGRDIASNVPAGLDPLMGSATKDQNVSDSLIARVKELSHKDPDFLKKAATLKVEVARMHDAAIAEEEVII